MNADSPVPPLLVLVTGPPASGKSTVAEALARRLGASVLGWDWAMAALTGFETVWSSIQALEGLEYRQVGWSLVWSLAEAQLRAGRSVVLDGVARDPEVTGTLALAQRVGAEAHVVALACSDAAERRRRVEGRRRNIPGWYELTLQHVEDSHGRWQVPAGVELVIDTATNSDPDELAGRLVASWDDRRMVERHGCDLCARIERAERGENPFAVARTAMGYVMLADVQYYEGYTVFVAKRCVAELHQLPGAERDVFLHEMALVAEAVIHAFKPRKLNHELLGNGAPHLHWHLFPRHTDDARPRVPVWNDPGFLDALERGPEDAARITALKPRLLAALTQRGLSIENCFEG